MLKKLWCDLHQSYFVIMLSIGILTGTILALIFRINYFNSPWWCGLAILLLIITYLKPKFIFIIIAFLSGMVLAFFRTSSELAGENYIRNFYNINIIVTGTIDGDPETDESGTKFKLVNLAFGNEKISSAGNLYISSYKNQTLKRNDTVTLSGKLSNGFGVYAGYMWRPKIISHSRPEPGDLILRIRDWFAERIKKLIPEPESLLGLSYLLGMKSGLPDDLNENLRTVGLVHIVVASGAHLAILVNLAKKLFGKISRFAALLFSILFIIFFMAMVGWTPSIMRAGIMTILNLLAWYVGRKIAPWRLILIVIASTLIVDPMFIINLGWLLSFASFAGIMILGPKLAKFFYGEKKPGFIGETIMTTLAATIMTLPITLYYYGQISLISILANLLILPTLPYAMGLTFLTGLVSGLPGIEIVISFLTTKLLNFHITVVEFFGHMTQFLIKIAPYQPQVFLIYPLILLPIISTKIKQNVKIKRS